MSVGPKTGLTLLLSEDVWPVCGSHSVGSKADGSPLDNIPLNLRPCTPRPEAQADGSITTQTVMQQRSDYLAEG